MHVDEFSFIEAIKQKHYRQSSLIKGIGDDGAIIRPTADVAVASDTFVENIHFSRDTMTPFHIGYRLLAANLSDMAAMGAVPAFYLVSIVIPETWRDREVQDIFHGMKKLASVYNIDLIGGDTVSGSELTITVMILGFTDKNRIRYRSAAKPGDVVFVTGTLGDAQAGFYILMNQDEYKNKDYFIRRHQMPEPRIRFSSEVKLSRVALNDISDGIASEAHEIAQASGVSITLFDRSIPVSEDYGQFPEKLQIKWKYFGGEDFELLGTVSEEEWEVVERIAEVTETKLTKIGYVSNEQPGSVFLVKNDKTIKLPKAGYIHLK